MISAAKSTDGSSMIRRKADKRKDRGTDAGRQVEVVIGILAFLFQLFHFLKEMVRKVII